MRWLFLAFNTFENCYVGICGNIALNSYIVHRTVAFMSVCKSQGLLEPIIYYVLEYSTYGTYRTLFDLIIISPPQIIGGKFTATPLESEA